MIDYNTILNLEIQGLYGNHLESVTRLNELYEIYEGKQEWDTAMGLDYEPTKKITNLIKKLINTRARFMFGREPFFDARPVDEGEAAKDRVQEKEDLLAKILKDNHFHKKSLTGYKDCCIGGKVGIKLWGHKEEGLKIVFLPAQEFFISYDVDDIDKFDKVVMAYGLNNEKLKENQRIKKQTWELINNKCILNEITVDGYGEVVSVEYQDYNTELDFIPFIVVQNGGLTGDTIGESMVEELWSNQDAYNKLNSDDIDALKFNMFPQTVATDADESSLKNLKIAPGALVDLQTDISQASQGKQAQMNILESHFSYNDKFQDTVNRVKSDMYDLVDVPNIGLEQLKGLMQSGKSMKALYWGLMAACDEDWVEWGSAFEKMVTYIFKMVDVYNLYGARNIAKEETTLEIISSYPLSEDELEQKQVDMQEVVTEVRSRESYIDKWLSVESVEREIEQIIKEKQMLQDSYTQDLLDDLGD